MPSLVLERSLRTKLVREAFLRRVLNGVVQTRAVECGSQLVGHPVHEFQLVWFCSVAVDVRGR